eukprot:m.1808 g.1808  ORF g.1808 m.1808 type:complete len:431 (+) comp7871_c0_seq2:49-1341(+)
MLRKLKRRMSRSTSSADRAGAHNWDQDAALVASETGISFPVKYLGSKEVARARGIEVCEDVVESFRPSTSKGKKKMFLVISLIGIRVHEQPTKAIVFDQPIEKIAFCAPDRHYERCFSYIARDAAARKWICHSFVTILPVTGERLSHAVGCSFSQCLQRKQRQDRLQRLHEQVARSSRGASETVPAAESLPVVETSPEQPTSTKAQVTIPAQQLQDLYATVHKPSKVPAVNELTLEETSSAEPNLLQDPSSSIPVSLFGPQNPSPALQQPKRTNMDPWDIITDVQPAQNVAPYSAPRPPSRTSTDGPMPVAAAAAADPWTVQPLPPPSQEVRQRPPRRDSVADEWLKSAIRTAASLTPTTPTEPGPFVPLRAPAQNDPFQPIPISAAARVVDPWAPITGTGTGTGVVGRMATSPDHEQWAALAYRHDGNI